MGSNFADEMLRLATSVGRIPGASPLTQRDLQGGDEGITSSSAEMQNYIFDPMKQNCV